MVWRDFGRYKPVRFARQVDGIFCQTGQLMMKKTVNVADGGFNGDEVEPLPEILRADQSTVPASSTRFCRSKDSLPKKCNLSGVSPNRGGKMLRNPLQHAGGIFCQTFQLTMKNTSRDSTGPNFRQREIGGQEPRHLGGLPPVGLAMAVRSNRLSGKLGGSQSILLGGGGHIHRRPAFCRQGHRRNHFRSKNILPRKHHLPGVLPRLDQYNFVRPVNKAIENFRQTRPVNERKEPKNTATTRGKPPPESQTGAMASLTSAARQISCRVCNGCPPFPARVPAMMKIISGRLVTRKTQTHFVSLIHLGRFPFWQDSRLTAGLTAKTKNHFVAK